MNNASLVNKYLGFLVTEYNMFFSVDELKDVIGVENPTFVYSYYNASGCFSVVEISQRNEWDWYYAKYFNQEPRLRLSKRIYQKGYINKSVFTRRKFLKITANVIRNQIEQTNSFWGIDIAKGGTRDGFA